MRLLENGSLNRAQKGETKMRKPNANKVGDITNYEEALEAVRKDSRALEYVPWGQMNLSFPAMEEICLEAVKAHGGGVLQYLPENLKTAELCLEAVKKRTGGFNTCLRRSGRRNSGLKR